MMNMINQEHGQGELKQHESSRELAAPWHVPIVALCGAIVLVLTSGCKSMPQISATRTSGTDLETMNTFYIVSDEEPNKRHTRVDRAVEGVLAMHGTVTTGPESAMPQETDCKVVVNDHWFWDLRWYLLKLEIELYDGQTGELIGSGSSRRADPSLRRDPDFMANEVIEAIFQALP